MKINKGFNLFLIIIISAVIIPLAGYGQEQSIIVNEDETLQVKPLQMDWPFNRHSGFVNYAQELIFDREIGKEYLDIARKYYINGFTLISNYQLNLEEYDPYIRDTFKVDASSHYGQGVYKDFILAEYWFLKCLKIVARNIEWDPMINSMTEFKTMIENAFKNLVYVTAYKGNYPRLIVYLQEYKHFDPDEKFLDEWEARALGNIVLHHKKFDWYFTGKKSAKYLINKHREYLLKVIDKYYSQDPELKKELELRIYPEFHIQSQEKKIQEDSSAAPETK